jgi:hypothetical protein
MGSSKGLQIRAQSEKDSREGGHEQLISSGGRFKPSFAERDKMKTASSEIFRKKHSAWLLVVLTNNPIPATVLLNPSIFQQWAVGEALSLLN